MCRLNRRSMSQRAGSIRRMFATVIDLIIFLIAWWLISILVEPPLRARIQTEWRAGFVVWLIMFALWLLFFKPGTSVAAAPGEGVVGRGIGPAGGGGGPAFDLPVGRC